uniref:Uncharacterized protein n=1 Tax=Anguilla anguilla TaxID=7936 RepID=A0A0E9QRY8_ANGAN
MYSVFYYKSLISVFTPVVNRQMANPRTSHCRNTILYECSSYENKK